MAGPIGDEFNRPAEKRRLRPKRGLEGFEGVASLAESELHALVTCEGAPWSWASRVEMASRLSLDFYPGYGLYELHLNHAEAGRPMFAIRKGDDARIVRESNALFYALNEEVPIRLTDDNVAFYVRVFFRFVRGRHGYFHIVESRDDVPGWGELDPAKRSSVEEHIVPLRVRTSSDGDGWKVDASVLFKEALFTSEIDVARDGTMDMGDGKLRVDGIRWSRE